MLNLIGLDERKAAVFKKEIIIFLLIFMFLVLSGCADDNNKQNDKRDINIEADYEEGVYPYKEEWSENQHSYKGDVIANKETAINVASAIFNNVKSTGACKNYVLGGVFFDTADDVWVVYFVEPDNTPGSTYNIAIKNATGEVINMWPGE